MIYNLLGIMWLKELQSISQFSKEVIHSFIYQMLTMPLLSTEDTKIGKTGLCLPRRRHWEAPAL